MADQFTKTVTVDSECSVIVGVEYDEVPLVTLAIRKGDTGESLWLMPTDVLKIVKAFADALKKAHKLREREAAVAHGE